MINNDTIELLKKCNASIKMGVTAIEAVLGKIKNPEFKEILSKSLEKHRYLGSETRELPDEYRNGGKEPDAVAKCMLRLKTDIMPAMNKSDETVADLITDGCNMGVKSLNKYLNRYTEAEEKVKDTAKKLIGEETQLTVDIRKYL